MLIEATQHPIRYRLLNGTQVRLAPGFPIDLPEEQAKTLLTKAPDRVRMAATRSPNDGGFLAQPTECRPVYWESENGRILGPGTVTHMAKETTVCGEARFWLCITYGNSWRWIHESLLRSRASYEAQWRKAAMMSPKKA